MSKAMRLEAKFVSGNGKVRFGYWNFLTKEAGKLPKSVEMLHEPLLS